MVSFGTYVNIACIVGPYLIPRALAFYRSLKNRPATQIRPPPPAARRALNLLFITTILALLLSILPQFQAPNIFTTTNSRLGIGNGLLFKKLSGLRPGGVLTPLDESLRIRFESEPADIRLLYAAYGPFAIADCPFCRGNEPTGYLYYHLLSVAKPHLLHTALLGLVTSPSVSGREGARWRTWATVAAVALALADLRAVYVYPWDANRGRRQLADVDFFFWRMHALRYVGFALLDAALGLALWLTSTNRWLVVPPSSAARLEEHNTLLGQSLASVSVLADVRNAVVRDPRLNDAADEYWRLEARVMDEAENEAEVVQAKNVALSKIDPVRLDREAQAVVDGVFGPLLQQQQQQQHSAGSMPIWNS